MKILFTVPYVPTLIRARPYNLIRALSAAGNEVTVATLWSGEKERAAVAALRKECHRVEAYPLPTWLSLWNSVKALPSRIPLQSVYCWQPELDRFIRQTLHGQGAGTRFDAIHIEHLRGARYGLSIKSHLPVAARPPIIWDSVDSISHLFQQAATQSQKLFTRLLTRLELGRTRWYEGYLSAQFERVLVTSPLDRKALVSLAKGSVDDDQIQVLQNGVDLDYFSPGADEHREQETLVISGKMSYHANISMTMFLVEKIMPIIWDARPKAKLWIVGKDPPAVVRDLAQNPAIKVTGTVEDIRPYLREGTVAAAPLTYGAGIQNKVLEAMACATPVVSTPQAISALTVQPGREILVAESPEEFARSVLCLFDNPALQREIGLAGRKFVENNHRWSVIAGRLEEIYTQAIRAIRLKRESVG
jgi:sugar transferase (PEP-CTERM/EpsH1 system associated)